MLGLQGTRQLARLIVKVVSCRQTVTLFSIAPRTHLPVGTRAPLPSRGYTQHAERVIGK
jgi:hypothetical protein